jgi:hypothetical protein
MTIPTTSFESEAIPDYCGNVICHEQKSNFHKCLEEMRTHNPDGVFATISDTCEASAFDVYRLCFDNLSDMTEADATDQVSPKC